jgi:hypothetical protein
MTFDAYDELCAWTLGRGDPEFVHQHVVDAQMLQQADEHTKPIGIAFALAGLYLFLELGYTGREVQRAHMKLGQAGGPWPRFALPDERGAVTAAEVLAAPAGEARTGGIRRWCASVWEPWSIHRARVIAMLQAHRIIP